MLSGLFDGIPRILTVLSGDNPQCSGPWAESQSRVADTSPCRFAPGRRPCLGFEPRFDRHTIYCNVVNVFNLQGYMDGSLFLVHARHTDMDYSLE